MSPLPHLKNKIKLCACKWFWCVESVRRVPNISPRYCTAVQCQRSSQGSPIQAPCGHFTQRVSEQMIIQRDHNKRGVEWVLRDSGCTSVRVPFPLLRWSTADVVVDFIDRQRTQQKEPKKPGCTHRARRGSSPRLAWLEIITPVKWRNQVNKDIAKHHALEQVTGPATL